MIAKSISVIAIAAIGFGLTVGAASAKTAYRTVTACGKGSFGQSCLTKPVRTAPLGEQYRTKGG